MDRKDSDRNLHMQAIACGLHVCAQRPCAGELVPSAAVFRGGVLGWGLNHLTGRSR